MVDWHSAADSKLPADVPETLLTAVHPDMLCAVHKQKTVGAYLCHVSCKHTGMCNCHCIPCCSLLAPAGIEYSGEPPMLTSYEKASAAFIFLNFVLSVGATIFAMRAVDEIRSKQREDYNRLTVLSDTLAFEPDRP